MYIGDALKWLSKSPKWVYYSVFVFFILLIIGISVYAVNHTTTNPVYERPRRTWLDNLQNELKSKPYVKLIEQPSAEVCSNNSHINIITQEAHQGPVLGYGTKSNGYVCLDVDNLLQGFSSDYYENPYQTGEKFTADNLKQMNTIVQNHPQLFTENQRQSFEGYSLDYSLQEERQNKDIQRLSKVENKEHLQRLFENLFYTGMYMRKWKGPGHTYPLLAKDTHNGLFGIGNDEIQMATKITDMYAEYNQHLNNLRQSSEEIYDIYQNLPMINMYNGNLHKNEKNISYVYHSTITSGDTCIRMRSTDFVSTGAYYMKIICNSELPDYHLGSHIEFIA